MKFNINIGSGVYEWCRKGWALNERRPGESESRCVWLIQSRTPKQWHWKVASQFHLAWRTHTHTHRITRARALATTNETILMVEWVAFRHFILSTNRIGNKNGSPFQHTLADGECMLRADPVYREFRVWVRVLVVACEFNSACRSNDGCDITERTKRNGRMTPPVMASSAKDS